MTRRTFLGLLASLGILSGCTGGGILAFLRQEQFGAHPEGAAMRRILASPHYADGEFHNLIPGPILRDDSSFAAAVLRSLFERRDNPVPPAPVPARRVDLGALDRSQDMVVWLGHSSFLLQLGGRRILVDPVFSPWAAPVSFSTRAFPGATPYTARDMPDIDCLLISHDHWDHLDYPSVTALGNRIRNVVCGLGTGAHFRRWGFPDRVIHEVDWGDTLELNGEIRIHAVAARHYSGRTLTRNKALWAGYVLETPRRRVFFSGDTGYGPHFAEAGKRFDGIDLALLDSGQYNERWPHIHMTPEEAVRAATDLRARHLLPAHVGKFALSSHPWDEPFRRVSAACRGEGAPRLLTPVIGDPVELTDRMPGYPRWWETLV